MATLKRVSEYEVLLSRMKVCYLSKYVPPLGCSKDWNRLSLVQDRFYSNTDITYSHSKVQRKKRDRLTVLKALASTVKDVPNRPDYRFCDDRILTPKAYHNQAETLAAIDSGKKAAEYVIAAFPDLFPMRDPVPAWPKQKMSFERALDHLRSLLKSDENNIIKVVDWYEKLDSEGEIPLDLHNEILDFVAFHDIPDIPDKNAAEEIDEDIYERVPETKKVNLADKLFSKLKTNANSMTYEVYILGLLKHGKAIDAFEIYNEMKEKDFCGSLYMYNTLLSHVRNVTQKGDKEKQWDLAEDIVAGIHKSNIKPDVVTFTSLMEVVEEDHKMCKDLFLEMRSLKISPSLGSYYFRINSEPFRPLKLKLVKETLKHLKSGVIRLEVKHSSDMKLFSYVMQVCRFGNNLELCEELFTFVTNNNLKHLLGAHSHLFNGHYLGACAGLSKNVDDVFEKYCGLLPTFIVPYEWVVEAMFNCMISNKDPKHVPAFYSLLMSLRIPISGKICYALFSAMQDNVPKERGEEFLSVLKDVEKQISVHEIKVDHVKILLVAIQILSLCENSAELNERMEQCEMLFKLMIERGNKEDAMRLLKTLAPFNLKLKDTFKQLIRDSNVFNKNDQKKIKSLNIIDFYENVEK